MHRNGRLAQIRGLYRIPAFKSATFHDEQDKGVFIACRSRLANVFPPDAIPGSTINGPHSGAESIFMLGKRIHPGVWC